MKWGVVTIEKYVLAENSILSWRCTASTSTALPRFDVSSIYLWRAIVDMPKISLPRAELSLSLTTSAGGISNNDRGDDWGILDTAATKVVFWKAVVPIVLRCGA